MCAGGQNRRARKTAQVAFLWAERAVAATCPRSSKLNVLKTGSRGCGIRVALSELP